MRISRSLKIFLSVTMMMSNQHCKIMNGQSSWKIKLRSSGKSDQTWKKIDRQHQQLISNKFQVIRLPPFEKGSKFVRKVDRKRKKTWTNARLPVRRRKVKLICLLRRKKIGFIKRVIIIIFDGHPYPGKVYTLICWIPFLILDQQYIV